VHVSPVVVAIHDEDEPLAEQMYMRAPDLMKPGGQSAAHAKPFATAPLVMLQPLADVHVMCSVWGGRVLTGQPVAAGAANAEQQQGKK
jgi:hypothetical protein